MAGHDWVKSTLGHGTQGLCRECGTRSCDPCPRATAGNQDIHLGLLDDADHEAKIDSDAEYRRSELRIHSGSTEEYWKAMDRRFGRRI